MIDGSLALLIVAEWILFSSHVIADDSAMTWVLSQLDSVNGKAGNSCRRVDGGMAVIDGSLVLFKVVAWILYFSRPLLTLQR